MCDGCGLEIVHSKIGPATQEFLVLSSDYVLDDTRDPNFSTLEYYPPNPLLPNGELHFHGFTCLIEYATE
jgi:hypothetical protein